jgi:hypothetical protein
LISRLLHGGLCPGLKGREITRAYWNLIIHWNI